MKLVIPKGAKLKGKIELEDKKIKTGLCRLSYVHLHGEPKEYEGKRTWSVQGLFDKKANINALEVAAYNAAIEKWGTDLSKWPKTKIKKNGKILLKNKVKMPFRDGDEEKPDSSDYEGKIFVGFTKNEFNSKGVKQRAPQVCGPNPKDGLIGEDEIKSGDYGHIVAIAFAYEVGKNAGVSFALQMVQKAKTGPALGNGGSVENEFEELEQDDEDYESDDEESDEDDASDSEDDENEDSEDDEGTDGDDDSDEDESEEDDEELDEEEDEEEEDEPVKKSSKKSSAKKPLTKPSTSSKKKGTSKR